MDLQGPKLRTGPIKPGPRVVRLRPKRDAWGRPTVPARALLVADEEVTPRAATMGATPVSIPVPKEWLKGIRTGDRIRLRDTRDSKRTVEVTQITDAGVWVEFSDTTYVATDTWLRRAIARRPLATCPQKSRRLSSTSVTY